MNFIQLVLISFGLAMDAFAVAVCKGLKMKKVDYRYTIMIAMFFGGFQGLMPFIGWVLGRQFEQYITRFDHWIAFILMAMIGGKMIYEAIKNEEDLSGISYDIREVVILAVATSIDALAVGIAFAFSMNSLAEILKGVIIIAVITFFCAFAGVFIGNHFGAKYKNKAEWAGGIILIVIGLKILLEGMGMI